MRVRAVLVAVSVLALCGRAPAQSYPLEGSRSWRAWWEHNRPELVGYRLPARWSGRRARKDEAGAGREKALAALREIAIAGDRLAGRALAIQEAGKGTRPTLRVSAIVALGRMGEDRDAHLLLGLVEDAEERGAVRQAAALALGMLPPLEDPAARARMAKELGQFVAVRRDVFKDPSTFGFVTVRKVLPTLARNMAWLSAGLRAREDPRIMMQLAGRAASGVKTQQEAHALALSLGLSAQRFLQPGLVGAVEGRPFAGKELEAVGLCHVAFALARMGDPSAAGALVRLLRTERVGPQVRRAAALALGRLLRTGVVGGDAAREVKSALAAALKERGRTIMSGFAAVALGAAVKPTHVQNLADALGRGKDPAFRCFAALALGLAARNSGAQQATWIQSLLMRALDKARQAQLEAALCLALGLAQAKDAIDPLSARIRKRSTAIEIRSAAVEGLGLLQTPSRKAEQALLSALKEARADLTEEVAIALARLGRRGVVQDLLAMLAQARGSVVRHLLRIPLMIALGRLGATEATEPLLRELRDLSLERERREAAIFALGMIGDPREKDVLFTALADFNFYARSTSSEELTRLSSLFREATPR